MIPMLLMDFKDLGAGEDLCSMKTLSQSWFTGGLKTPELHNAIEQRGVGLLRRSSIHG